MHIFIQQINFPIFSLLIGSVRFHIWHEILTSTHIFTVCLLKILLDVQYVFFYISYHIYVYICVRISISVYKWEDGCSRPQEVPIHHPSTDHPVHNIVLLAQYSSTTVQYCSSSLTIAKRLDQYWISELNTGWDTDSLTKAQSLTHFLGMHYNVFQSTKIAIFEESPRYCFIVIERSWIERPTNP